MIQIDSVNVLSRSHYLPFFSRLGPYPQAELDRLRDRAPRALIEYWAHEASLVTPEVWHELRFRMDRADTDAWGSVRRVIAEHPELHARVLDVVARHGPLTAREAEWRLAHDATGPRTDWGWNWSAVKTMLEYQFFSGQISSAGRTSQFERRYALPERVLAPRDRAAWRAPRLDDAAAVTALVQRSARALGVATGASIRDYFRLGVDDARRGIAACLESGVLIPVTVDGWPAQAYLHHQARVPRSVSASALLSPFDSLIWDRRRTQELFGFHYRLEIYVPGPQRVHGYYVLPFLLGDRLVARVDLKAERLSQTLHVKQVSFESGAPSYAAQALSRELALLASWLGLAQGVVGAP